MTLRRESLQGEREVRASRKITSSLSDGTNITRTKRQRKIAAGNDEEGHCKFAKTRKQRERSSKFEDEIQSLKLQNEDLKAENRDLQADVTKLKQSQHLTLPTLVEVERDLDALNASYQESMAVRDALKHDILRKIATCLSKVRYLDRYSHFSTYLNEEFQKQEDQQIHEISELKQSSRNQQDAPGSERDLSNVRFELLACKTQLDQLSESYVHTNTNINDYLDKISGQLEAVHHQVSWECSGTANGSASSLRSSGNESCAQSITSCNTNRHMETPAYNKLQEDVEMIRSDVRAVMRDLHVLKDRGINSGASQSDACNSRQLRKAAEINRTSSCHKPQNMKDYCHVHGYPGFDSADQSRMDASCYLCQYFRLLGERKHATTANTNHI
uniref:AlNc14C77G5127 protein n=1 Tax=Albugo laibachii Nc14 TaxID=890382 RepID=F0WES7_9STRA|nr:AlNc14C77G5127 [Albugo laibachii Nc14]|eukprot:CCA19709.1 AlNc14C77G5127 [Albugo laibachii Nc14]